MKYIKKYEILEDIFDKYYWISPTDDRVSAAAEIVTNKLKSLGKIRDDKYRYEELEPLSEYAKRIISTHKITEPFIYFGYDGIDWEWSEYESGPGIWSRYIYLGKILIEPHEIDMVYNMRDYNL